MNRPALLAHAAIVAVLALLPAGDAVAQNAVKVCTRPAAGFFAKDRNGTARGLEYDILSSFGQSASIVVHLRDTPSFDQALKDTESGTCDIGSATITITKERQERVLFSVPYFPNRILIVQKSSSTFATEADLKGKRVAAVTGTVSAPLVAAIPGATPVAVANDDASFTALLNGDVDALACDSAVVLDFLKKNPELGMAFPIGERSFFGFAFPKGSTLVAPFNEHIRKLLRTGEMKKLLAKHFGAANAGMLEDDIAEAAGK